MKRLSLVAALLMVATALPASAEDAPGVFKVPGTDSTIKFYGYVQLDTTLDFSGRPGDIENNDWATALFAVPSDNSVEGKRHNPQWYLTARTSRFGIQTNTPSKYGNIGVKLEGDFNGPNGFQSETFTNSVLFRLRHAYGTMGGLLVGQTWSTFLDLGAAPDTVDFNGPGTLALVRNPMVRYSFGLGQGMTLALAAENRRGIQYGGEAFMQTFPDIHANFTYGADWGHVSARVVSQRYSTAPATDTSSDSLQVIDYALSGSVKVAGTDTLVAQFSGGEGIGRYLLNAAGSGFVGFDGADLKGVTVHGVHAGYTHVWNPEMRSNLVAAYAWATDPKFGGVASGTGRIKDYTQFFVNTFFTLTKTTEVGVEYAYGQWKSFGTPDDKGTQNRVNASFHYNFF